mgnify:CR=1 FL=1
MWIYFNQIGSTPIQINYNTPARVGSVGVFSIFAHFHNIDLDLYNEATISFEKPDRTHTVTPNFFMVRGTKRYFEHLNYDHEPDVPFLNGIDYEGYNFAFNYTGLLDTEGLWKATITLYKQDGTKNVAGQITFNVEESVVAVNEEFNYDQFDEIMSEIVTKLDIDTNFYLRVVSKISTITNFLPPKFPLDDEGNRPVVFDRDSSKFYRITGTSQGDYEEIDLNLSGRFNKVIANHFYKGTEAAENELVTKEYVDEHGGKIDKIIVDDVEQTITNKTVSIDLMTTSTYEGLHSSLENKVDKIENTEGVKVYIKRGTTDTGIVASKNVTQNDSVMLRDQSGRSQISNPVERMDIANKAYVDDSSIPIEQEFIENLFR